MLQERLENLNVELKEWKKQYKNMEKEKECLFFEVKLKTEMEVSNLVCQNEEMKKYVWKLEKDKEENIKSGVKSMSVTFQSGSKAGNKSKHLEQGPKKPFGLPNTLDLSFTDWNFYTTKGRNMVKVLPQHSVR